ncbi:MAG: beta-lactamase family protein [Planctomycetes bacterium]|nr:beta-lactamase family protein [Planctomycetota bacterium]
MRTSDTALLLIISCTACARARELDRLQSAPDETTDDGRIAARVDAFLNASGVRGGILVAKNGKVILSNGYGWADGKHTIPISTETVFDIGSITKQFTAAAILKLQEEGKLRVTDSITKFFGNVPPDKQTITVRQLLTHTGGFAHDAAEPSEILTRDAAADRILNSKLLLKPGERYGYSNAGYALLAIIVEIASGAPYENYLYYKLWKPSGMLKTGFAFPNSTDREIAHGFDISGDLGSPRQRWGNDGPSWGGRGAGGVLSTLEDLYKWHRALEGGEILTNESKAEMFTPRVPENDQHSSYYGYGWAIFTTPRNTRLITHDGSNGTFFADFRRYVDENVVIIYFTSERNSVSRSLISSVPDAFFGAEVPDVPRPTAEIELSKLENYTGTYRLPSGASFALELCNHQLSTAAATPGACKLLTTFPKLENSARVREAESASTKLITSILNGELDSVREMLQFDGAFEEEAAYWSRTRAEWTKRFGQFAAPEILGTAIEKNLLITYVLLQFERGTTIVQLRQEVNKKYFVGTGNNLLPGDYRFIRRSDAEFIVYNHSLRTSTRVRFDVRGKNGDGGMTIFHADGETRAEKTSR